MERDGRESLLFYQQREQEVDKERQEEISEGEGERRDEDTSDGEEVDEGSRREEGASEDRRETIVWSAKRSRKSSGTNFCNEEYTARIS